MDYNEFIEKEELTLDGVKFAMSAIPAFQAQQIYGDIVRATSGVGDIGMTFLPEDVAKKLLSYVAFLDGDVWFTLDQEQRIDRAFKKVDSLLKLEVAMIRKNFGFLFDGGLLNLVEDLRGVAKADV